MQWPKEKKTDKRKNNDLQNTTQNTKWTPGVSTDASEGLEVPATLVTPVV